MQATTNKMLQDVNLRLQKLENVMKKRVANSVINNILLQNSYLLERIKQFELLLETKEEAITQFVSLFVYLFCGNRVLFKS